MHTQKDSIANFNQYPINLEDKIIKTTKMKSRKQNKQIKLINLELAYSKSLPLLEKMIIAISASHKIESSRAFFNKPTRLFENVTCLLLKFSIFSI